ALLAVQHYWPGPWFGLSEELTPLAALCCGLAGAALSCRGLGVMLYACRVTEVCWTDYLGQVVLPAVLLSAGPISALALACQWHRPATWLELLAYGTTFSLLHVAVCVGLPRWRRLPLTALRLPALLRRAV
ncbi:MAG: hypothetical protein JNM56_12380, partial [Planctomycetia bacterium]|nr:hypothetical protein [Planctomycetia bacterium]